MSNWISVKERLPSREGLLDSENEYVLVVYKSMFTGRKLVGICGYGKSGFDENDCYGVVYVSGITHWMPMPEPPEEKEE